MNKNEEAYCKHDLNVLSAGTVDTESHYPKTQVSSMYGMMCDELVESTQVSSMYGMMCDELVESTQLKEGDSNVLISKVSSC